MIQCQSFYRAPESEIPNFLISYLTEFFAYQLEVLLILVRILLHEFVITYNHDIGLGWILQ